MASRKLRRENTAVPETSTACTLPTDLMLEIVTRSDPRGLVRCAAASKLLRRDILTAGLIRRVCQPAPCILASLCTYHNKLSTTLVHPVTHGSASFCDDHLTPFLSRNTAGLFDEYKVLASRCGLVLLQGRITKDHPETDSRFDLCVYDPMSGARTFLSEPPEIKNYDGYVLLTAADGIDCPFLLLVAYQYGWDIRMQTASSCGTWGPVTNVCGWSLQNHCNPAVLRGGVIHWLECYEHKQIVSYDVATGKLRSVKLPPTCCDVSQLHLATSLDGKLLKLLAIERFLMFVWLQIPVSAATDGSDWSLDGVVDMEEKLRSLFPDIADGLNVPVEFQGSGKRNGEVVFLEVCRQGICDSLIGFNLGTKEVHIQKRAYTLLEIDLASRLQTIKIFS